RENPLEAGQRQMRRTNNIVQNILGSISTLKLKQNERLATEALRIGLRRIPEPRSEAESLEADAVNSLRGLNRRLAAVTSGSDFEQLVPDFERGAEVMREGSQKRESVREQQPDDVDFADNLYQPYVTHAVRQMRALINLLESRYQGRERFQSAV